MQNIDRSNYTHVCTCSGMELTFTDSDIKAQPKSLKRSSILQPYVVIFGEELRLNESEISYYKTAGVPIIYK